MSEESAQEKSEQPTGKRLADSKRKGQVARSKDFNSFVIVLSSAGLFLLLGDYIASSVTGLMQKAFRFSPDILTSMDATFAYASALGTSAIYILLPFLLLLAALGIVASILVGGWVFSMQTMAFNLNKLDPIKGMKKIFSLRGLVELVKALFKFFIVGGTAVLVLRYRLPEFLSIQYLSVDVAITKGIQVLVVSFLVIASSMLLLALFDVPYQIWEHLRQLKMTKQEVKDELKETEGKPEVKSQLRKQQRLIAQRRMMEKVPQADVILTNPTHFSVALKYERSGSGAPVLIAKGKDFLALQISKIALAKKIPVIQVPPLARAIYFSTELDSEIPEGLYVAVAQVLAYVYQIKRKDQGDDYEKSPDFFRDLPIPDSLFVPEDDR